MKNIVLGSLLAAMVLFVWGGVAHLLLPLGSMGLQSLPHERSLLLAMDLALDEPGLYVFPGMEEDEALSRKNYADWEERYREGPVGLLLYDPQGRNPMALSHFLIQFGNDLLAALLAAILLACTRLGFGGRVAFVTAMGLFSWLVQIVPYWNWHGFPDVFILVSGLITVVGWMLAALVLAALPARR